MFLIILPVASILRTILVLESAIARPLIFLIIAFIHIPILPDSAALPTHLTPTPVSLLQRTIVENTGAPPLPHFRANLPLTSIAKVFIKSSRAHLNFLLRLLILEIAQFFSQRPQLLLISK